MRDAPIDGPLTPPPTPTLRSQTPFQHRYGPWALVAGASEGLGAAFAASVARRGVNLILVARRAEVLGSLAERLATVHHIEVTTAAVDLASADVASMVNDAVGDRDVGLIVYNAAFAPVGAFLDTAAGDLMRAVDVNVRGPVAVIGTLGPAMVRRGRGGVVLMSSLAGFQGTPRIAMYSATKAFTTTLGEALWQELDVHGIDVVTCAAGAIATPNYARTNEQASPAPGTLEATDVAEAALAALGRGPVVIPGLVNKLAATVLRRLLPRSMAIRLMASTTRELQ